MAKHSKGQMKKTMTVMCCHVFGFIKKLIPLTNKGFFYLNMTADQALGLRPGEWTLCEVAGNENETLLFSHKHQFNAGNSKEKKKNNFTG